MTTTKFKPGQTGNAKGRPKDRTPATLLRKSIAEAMPEIIDALIVSAKAGDVAAAKVLLDRVCPTLKPQAMPISLPVNGTLDEQGGEIIRATMAGQIPPDIGSQLIAAITAASQLAIKDNFSPPAPPKEIAKPMNADEARELYESLTVHRNRK